MNDVGMIMQYLKYMKLDFVIQRLRAYLMFKETGVHNESDIRSHGIQCMPQAMNVDAWNNWNMDTILFFDPIGIESP